MPGRVCSQDSGMINLLTAFGAGAEENRKLATFTDSVYNRGI